MASEHCACPGPNAISPTGCCDRCGVEGSKRQEAIRSALASGRQIDGETRWQEGLQRGYELGLERGVHIGRADAEADRLTYLPFRGAERDIERDEPELEAG